MTHRIVLDDGRSFDAREDQTLLDAADAAGIRLPRGCRVGACCTCAARLQRGKVAQVAGTALTDDQKRYGFVLPCVAYARDACTLEIGPGLLPVLPWTD